MNLPPVSIYSEPLPEYFRWTPDNYKGGTPEFCVETSRALKKLGYEVTVYYDGESQEFEGIYFLPRELYDGGEIVIAQNSRPPVLGKRNIYWTSLYTDREKDFLDFDKRVVLSKYHQSIFGKNSEIVSLGYWPDQFVETKKENICLYSSSPDGIWKLKEFPFEKYGYRFVQTYNGDYSEEDMIDLYDKAKFWLHPGKRIELFCISALKAQVAGCIPVVIPTMALDETVKIGIKTTEENYFKELEKSLINPPKISKIKFLDWVESTCLLLK